MPRKDGAKKQRLKNGMGEIIKPRTRLNDYYSRKLELFVETLLTENYAVWRHLERKAVKPGYEVRRGGRHNRGTFRQSNSEPRRGQSGKTRKE